MPTKDFKPPLLLMVEPRVVDRYKTPGGRHGLIVEDGKGQRICMVSDEGPLRLATYEEPSATIITRLPPSTRESAYDLLLDQQRNQLGAMGSQFGGYGLNAVFGQRRFP